jgi:hypothetical protein
VFWNPLSNVLLPPLLLLLPLLLPLLPLWLLLMLLHCAGQGLLLPNVMTRFMTSCAAGTIMLTTKAEAARQRLQRCNIML